MKEALRELLQIQNHSVTVLNELFLDPQNEVMDAFLDTVLRYGSPKQINQKAKDALELPTLLEKVRARNPAYLQDLSWLQEMQQKVAFISEVDYRRKILGPKAEQITFKDDYAVTLEISACQYFPWLMQLVHRALSEGELVPGRFIRVRQMKEQEADGDLPAMVAAMQIMGASWVEQLDTRGADGSNIHLGGPETIIGYFGGVGQPNDYPLRWVDEFLYYYTQYGVQEVLNLSTSTVLLGYFLYRLGVDIRFKISVTMGNDSPYAALWTLLAAKLFARPDGSTPLVGFNWSNSVNKHTIEATARIRRQLGLEKQVRFEHHVTETWRGIVIQPYNRREDILALADHVPNISAKHEGGEPEMEAQRDRPSDIQDYYRNKAEIIETKEWEALTLNFMDKYDSVQSTARALTEQGCAFIAARNLHHTSS